ncbi:ribonuclease H-like protein [Trametopsis cervina]|nr:ribonuclease H-like protein [Trametopsis cervina]
MSKAVASTSKAPSSNWLALKKKIKPASTTKRDSRHFSRKKRKLEHDDTASDVDVPVNSSTNAFPRGAVPYSHSEPVPSTSNLPDEIKNGESLAYLRRMISGDMQYTEAQKLPGKYLALDCEMVGVGIDGTESSLARVSLVNFHGAVLLDEIVRQRERVVDYRTEFSGIRPSDMVRAQPFEEVQKQVAELLKDRVLVGHAVHNDLKALLLSHPYPMTRDTQVLAGKHKVMKTKRPALRHLVHQEVGATIQGGEHSSVTDARATMAVYRIHRKAWDKGFPRPSASGAALSRKRSITQMDGDGDDDDEAEEDEDAIGRVAGAHKSSRTESFPGGGRKGVSSGLSVVVKRKDTKTKSGWWKDLGGATG